MWKSLISLSSSQGKYGMELWIEVKVYFTMAQVNDKPLNRASTLSHQLKFSTHQFPFAFFFLICLTNLTNSSDKIGSSMAFIGLNQNELITEWNSENISLQTRCVFSFFFFFLFLFLDIDIWVQCMFSPSKEDDSHLRMVRCLARKLK